MEAVLIATPTDKSVPDDEASGTVTVQHGKLLWIGRSGKRQSEAIGVSDIERKQQAKDSTKLRIVLKNGTAYIFQLPSPDIRDQLVRLLSGDVPSTTAAPASMTGNLSLQLSKGGAAASRGAAIGETAVASKVGVAATPSSRSTDPLSGQNLAELKQIVLSAHPEVAMEFHELALGGSTAGAGGATTSRLGLISDSDFWSEPEHRGLLVEAAARRAVKKGMSGLLGGVDAVMEERAGANEVRLRITDDYRLRVFTKEPRIFEAYKAFVPLKCTEREFWTRYYTANNLRNKTLLEVTGTRSSQGRPGVGTAASSIEGPVASKYDLRLMSLDQFFDLYQRGVIDDGNTSGGLGGAHVSAHASRPSSKSSSAHDPRFDLTSTAEDVVRSRRAGETFSRAGYGTSGSAAAYDVPDEMLPSGPGGAVRAEALGKAARQADSVIREVNRGTSHLLAHMDVSAGVGPAGVRLSPSSAAAWDASGIGNSAADDLPDLYNRVRPESAYAVLKVDMHAVRLGMETQGEHDDAMAVDGLGSGEGGWTVEGDVHTVGRKRARSVDLGPGGGWGDGARGDTPQEVPPRPDPLVMMGKSGKAARAVLLEVTRSAHDIFAATARSSATGFSRDMPAQWQAFLQYHFRLDMQYQAFTWRALEEVRSAQEKQARAFAAARERNAGSASSAHSVAAVQGPSAAVLDKARQLVARLGERHDVLEGLKRRVERDGAIAVVPPLPASEVSGAGAGGGGWVGGSALSDPDKARAEVIKALILLQGYTDKALDAGKALLLPL